MRVAAVDCGTNSIRLLVVDVGPGAGAGAPRQLVRELRVVRLGQGVDRTGELAPEAVERTLAVVEEYARTCREHAVERLLFCATSAARDARNGAAFAAGVRRITGVDPVVLSGDEEAALTYAGVVRGLEGLADPVLVADLGGGSTELVLGTSGSLDRAISLDVGSVRLTERHLSGDGPPGVEAVSACRADVAAALGGVPFDLAGAGTLVGVAGTVSTVAVLALGLDDWDPEVLHGARVPAADVLATCDRLVSASVAERRALGVHPGRADVIGGGAQVLEAVLRASGAAHLVVSESDVLDGIAARAAGLLP